MVALHKPGNINCWVTRGIQLWQQRADLV